MKKIIYLILSNLFIFIIYPIIRFANKKFYEKKILPSVINSTCNSRPIQYQRKKVVPKAFGIVLEIGIGSGHNLKYYEPSKVTKIYGVDPSNELNKLAKDKASKYNLDVAKELRNKILNNWASLGYSINNQQLLSKHTESLKTLKIILNKHINDIVDICNKEVDELGINYNRNYERRDVDPSPYQDRDIDKNYKLFV